MMTRKALRPVLQDAPQSTGVDMLMHHALWHVRQTTAAECGVHHLVCAVERSLPFRSNLNLARTLLQLPGDHTAVCWKSQVDAVVRSQILRHLRHRAVIEIAGRP